MRLDAIQHTVDLSLEELVDELVAARAILAVQQQAVWYLEKAVIEGMQERGATLVKTDAGEATLRTPVLYDYEGAKIYGDPQIKFKERKGDR